MERVRLLGDSREKFGGELSRHFLSALLQSLCSQPLHCQHSAANSLTWIHLTQDCSLLAQLFCNTTVLPAGQCPQGVLVLLCAQERMHSETSALPGRTCHACLLHCRDMGESVQTKRHHYWPCYSAMQVGLQPEMPCLDKTLPGHCWK